MANFCAAILILKIEKYPIFSVYYVFYLNKSKNATEMQKEILQYMEKVLWLIKYVKSGLQSFLVLWTFWPSNSLLWGCLIYWNMFSSPPGLYPLEANCGREQTYLTYPNQYSYWWKWKMSFILRKKHNGLFGQPNNSLYSTLQNLEQYLIICLFRVYLFRVSLPH